MILFIPFYNYNRRDETQKKSKRDVKKNYKIGYIKITLQPILIGS